MKVKKRCAFIHLHLVVMHYTLCVVQSTGSRVRTPAEPSAYNDDAEGTNDVSMKVESPSQEKTLSEQANTTVISE